MWKFLFSFVSRKNVNQVFFNNFGTDHCSRQCIRSNVRGCRQRRSLRLLSGAGLQSSWMLESELLLAIARVWQWRALDRRAVLLLSEQLSHISCAEQLAASRRRHRLLHSEERTNFSPKWNSQPRGAHHTRNSSASARSNRRSGQWPLPGACD